MTGEKNDGIPGTPYIAAPWILIMGDGRASMGHIHLQRVAEQPAKELNKNNAICS